MALLKEVNNSQQPNNNIEDCGELKKQLLTIDLLKQELSTIKTVNDEKLKQSQRENAAKTEEICKLKQANDGYKKEIIDLKQRNEGYKKLNEEIYRLKEQLTSVKEENNELQQVHQENVSNIEKIDRLKQENEEYLTEIKSQKETINTITNTSLTNDDKYNKLQQENVSLNAKLSLIETEHEQKWTQLKQNNDEQFERINILKQTIQKHQTTIESLNNINQQSQENIHKLNQSNENTIQSLQSQINEKDEKISVYTKSHETLKNEIISIKQDYKDKYNKLQQDSNKLMQILEEYNEKTQRLKDTNKEHLDTIKVLTEQYNTFKQQNEAKCNSLRARITTLSKRLSTIQTEHEQKLQMQQQLFSSTSENDQILHQMQLQIEQKHNAYEDLKQVNTECVQRIRQLTQMLQNSQNDQNNQRKMSQTYKSNIDMLKQQLSSSKQELQQLQQENNTLEQQIKSAKHMYPLDSPLNDTTSESCHQEIKQLRDALAAAQAANLEMTSLVGVNQKLPTVQETIKSFRSIRDQSHHNTSTELQKYIKANTKKHQQFQKYYLNQIIHQIMFETLFICYDEVQKYKQRMYDNIAEQLNIKYALSMAEKGNNNNDMT